MPTTEVMTANYISLLKRLNNQSVEKRFEAYRDINWDDPAMQLETNTEFLELGDEDPLGSTEWYRSQPQDIRAQIGLERVVSAARIGIDFENVLMRGLLLYAYRLQNNDPSFRYIMHEVSEECQHSMMFQELINRSRLPVRGLPPLLKAASHFVVLSALLFPELFFVFVLAGEDPIDYVQRRMLRRRANHPLIERIMRIHVTEEARHVSFARHFLKYRVPRMSRWRKLRLAVATPLLLSVMANLMLKPPKALVKRYNIPRHVLQQAYQASEGKAYLAESVSKIRSLFEELGLAGRPFKSLWKLLGLYPE